MLVMRKSQLGSLSRNSYYVTFFFIRYIYIYVLVSSKMEFLLHKKNSGFSFTSTIQITPMLTVV